MEATGQTLPTAEMMTTMGFYEILQVDPGDTGRTLRPSFAKLAKLHHPDKGGDPAKFKIIKFVYEVLSDKKNATSTTSVVGPLLSRNSQPHRPIRRQPLLNKELKMQQRPSQSISTFAWHVDFWSPRPFAAFRLGRQ